jgi:hypothetical protein
MNEYDEYEVIDADTKRRLVERLHHGADLG